MWLAFCDADDPSAAWLIAGLRRRGLTPLVPITPEALVTSQRLVHHVTDSSVRTRFTLPDGRTIDTLEIAGAINRLGLLPLDLLARASASDGWYAGQEMQAVVLSLLEGLGDRAVNRPVPPGLSGPEAPFAQWCVLAGRAGLAVPPLTLGTGGRQEPLHLIVRGTCVVFDQATFGTPVPAQVAAACVRLASTLGTRLLSVSLAQGDNDGWVFAGASPRGDVRIGGDGLLDALTAALRRSAS